MQEIRDVNKNFFTRPRLLLKTKTEIFLKTKTEIFQDRDQVFLIKTKTLHCKTKTKTFTQCQII